MFKQFKNSIDKKYFQEVINLQCIHITTMIFGILTTALIVRSISTFDYGRYVFVLSIIDYLRLATLPGMNFSITKGVLKNYDHIYTASLKIIILSTFSISFIILSLIVFTDYFDLVTRVILNENIRDHILSVDWYLIAIASILIIPTGLERYDGFMLAKRKFSLLRNIKLFNGILGVVLIGGSAFFFNKIEFILLGFFFHRIVNILIGNYFALKERSTVVKNMPLQKGLIKEGIKYNIIDLLGLISRLDRIILGTIDPKLLAVYYIAQRFPDLIKNNAKHFIVPVLIRWGKLDATSHWQNLRKKLLYFLILGFIVAILISIISVLGIPLVFGRAYNESIRYAVLLSVPIIFLFANHVIFDFDTVQGTGANYRLFNIPLPLIYGISILILVPKYQIMGLVYAIYLGALWKIISSVFVYIRYEKIYFKSLNKNSM
ncbi:lipopolysaccharide biosynthesis protein [Thermodesulfobacteriota bacterium]